MRSNGLRRTGACAPRGMTRPVVSTLALLLLACAARGQDQDPAARRDPDLRHVHPERDAEVPVSGWPTWIENLTIGSPVADHGSHAGLKASVTTDAPMHAQSFLGAAHYSGFQAVASQVDQSLLYLVEGDRALLAPPASRSVRFHPWGWEEVARGDGLEARGAVTTLSTNVFLVTARIVNTGATARTLSPRLALLADGDGVHEGMHPLHLSGVNRWKATVDRRGAALISYRRGTSFAPLAWDRQKFFRSIATNPPLVRVRGGLEPYAASPRRWSSTLELQERVVGPGGSLEVSFVIGCGAGENEAKASLAAGVSALDDAPGALRRVQAAWAADLAALPKAHTTDPDQARLYQLAYTGLRHNRYAKRDALTGTMNTASKMHFNAFYVWDVAIAALGESNWDPALGRELMQEVFRGQQPEGHLHYAIGPDRKPVSGLIRKTSQPPVHGWVAERVLERGEVDGPWLGELYERSAGYLAFFERERDPGRSGSFGFVNALETGWDDTPRYPGLHPAPELDLFGTKIVLGNLSGLLPVKDVKALDLNAWLVAYYRAMARWAEELGRPRAEVDGWAAKAAALSQKIDDEMWDPVTGTYRDLRTRDGRREPVRVDTPVVAWPLFMGVARDPERVRQTVENYLLDPARCFGDPDDPARPFFPVPSVAYDDPEYDHEKHGYYWRGQAWLIPAYATVEALYKYGYEAEARELKRRILRGVTKAHSNGIYETYDARTSEIGFGSGSLTGAGEPAAFLIGLSCAPVAELLLDRFERERFVSARDTSFSGHVLEARDLSTDRLIYKAARAHRALVPRVHLTTRDGSPLLAPSAAGLELTLTDPPGNLAAGPVRVLLAGRAGWTLWGVAGARVEQLPARVRGQDLVLEVARTDAGPFERYVLLPPGADRP